MIAPIRNPLGVFGLAASATERLDGQQNVDPLHTNLAPELEEVAEEQHPPKTERGHDTDASCVGGLTSLPGSRAGGDAFKGPFGLSDEALSRLEAGLRAQRDQQIAAHAQPAQAAYRSRETRQDPGATRLPKRIGHLRLVSLALFVTVITGWVAYYLIGEGPTKAPENVPALDAIETAPVPDLVVHTDARAPISIEPSRPAAIESESPPTEPINPSLNIQAAVPNMPAQLIPSSDPTPQKSRRKKHPATRSNR